MCKENAEDSVSSLLSGIKEESSNVDSQYFDDIFKGLKIENNENLQQVLKLCFKISYAIEDFDFLEVIYPKILESTTETPIFNYHRTQNYEELENYLEDLWACEILAQAKYDSDDKNSAITVCKQAIRLNHNSRASWNLLGKIYKEQGNMEEAMECFLSSLKSIPVNFSLIPVYLEYF
jgi:tetratricopeptide (TPR) repeat protein